ncbi:MAG: NAD(P)/FAD-dependent oxidoreductase, partial [Acidimicrobiales bacterium]|nr:NAD(P)/FAD-dependent oxidoreductase [Acidimicrobiales bacterium]
MATSEFADISADELREKYEEERLKRLRSEGNEQYVELKQYKDFDADPYTPLQPRDPMTIETEVLIVGAGWGGMTTAAFLRKNGVDDFRIIDKAGDFGGTWYWNRYPGCMCDVESYTYLPLLEETGYMPKRKYAHASEIFEYAQMLGRKYDMYENAIFQTEVLEAEWDEGAHRWQITTNRGDHIAARFFVICGGVLHKAKLPGIPGIRDFQGEAFHTSRWDYSITGGAPEEPMDKLGDKVVGIIGTGATAVQAVPKLAEAAKQLYVFQRTPSAVGPRNQRDTDPAEWAEITAKPGWQQERIENFTGMITGKNPPVDLVKDGWTELLGEDPKRPPRDDEDAKYLELMDFQKMQTIRDRIDEIVQDPETADKLKPWYKVSCKRPCFHDDYLPAFNRDNVTLVDTDGYGVERITENAVVVDGQEYPVDILIYASGFEVLTFYTHRLGFDPKGTDGVAMSDAWSKGPNTLFGIHTNGFPNMMMNSAIQGGQDVNFAFTLTQTGKQIAYTISEALGRGATKVEPSPTAESEWFDVIVSTLASYGAYFQDCTPSYLNNEGA